MLLFIIGDFMKSEENIYYKSAIGADEVGTGEVFRPQVFVACFVPNYQILMLEQMGVKDSKKLTRKKCCELGAQLINIIPYTSFVLTNERYNELYSTKFSNMNQIKAIVHRKTILDLYNSKEEKTDVAILDGFCDENKFYEYIKSADFIDGKLKCISKGEDIHIAVACASIIATYLEELEINKIEDEIQRKIPGGNGKICNIFAKEMLKEHGPLFLHKYAKMNFSNIKELLDK